MIPVYMQTYIGNVLIAVNPFKKLSIFTQKEIGMYQGAVRILTNDSERVFIEWNVHSGYIREPASYLCHCRQHVPKYDDRLRESMCYNQVDISMNNPLSTRWFVQRWKRSWQNSVGQIYHGIHFQSIGRSRKSGGMMNDAVEMIIPWDAGINQ